MKRRGLPSGTITLMSTDIEGSTRLLQALGEEAYGAALADHRRVIREASGGHGGVEVDTQGDAFLIAFPTARGAIFAAREAVEGLAHGPIHVRIGVHTGTPAQTGEGYVGADLHRVARIAASGHGGQVLVSASTRALIEGVDLKDLGEHFLKDLSSPEHIHQLGVARFPPLRSFHRSNLPVAAGAIVGRVEELTAIKELILQEDVRLLTLTGPGGAGKTRLALQIAQDVSESFADGSFWVPLAPIRDPALVVSAIAGALGITEVVAGGLEAAVLDHLRGKRTLLLIDNIEHLLPDAADTVRSVITTEGPSVLLTSRERLRLPAERAWPVPPLSEHDGTELFVQRASQAGSPAALSPAVTELCSRLDGSPLAIELAAARSSLFTPEQLLERLPQRLDLFKAQRGADPRQQTLRATIDWSYELLDEAERRLFERLSVFVGGATYDAAAQVAGADPDTLQALIDKSLVRRRDAATGPRYAMLDTIREFAAERLEEGTAPEETPRAHARWFAERGASVALGTRRREPEAVAVLDDELANMRAGLQESISWRDAATTGQYLFALWFYWLERGFGQEARTAATAWLALDRDSLDPLARCAGLMGAGEILRWTGDPLVARALKVEQLEIARAHPDESFHGWQFRWLVPAILDDLSQIDLHDGRVDDAESHASEALVSWTALGLPFGIAHTETTLAEIRYARGDYAGSLELSNASAGRLRSHGRYDLAVELAAAAAEIGLGMLSSAGARLGAMSDDIELRDRGRFADFAHVAALLAARGGDSEKAAQLFGAEDRVVRESGTVMANLPPERAAREGIRAALEPHAFDTAKGVGASLTDSAVLALVAGLLAVKPDANP